MKKFISLLAMLLYGAGCVSAPYTGRSQVILVSEGQEASLEEDAYRHSLRDSVVTHDYDA